MQFDRSSFFRPDKKQGDNRIASSFFSIYHRFLIRIKNRGIIASRHHLFDRIARHNYTTASLPVPRFDLHREAGSHWGAASAPIVYEVNRFDFCEFLAPLAEVFGGAGPR